VVFKHQTNTVKALKAMCLMEQSQSIVKMAMKYATEQYQHGTIKNQSSHNDAQGDITTTAMNRDTMPLKSV